MIGARRCWRRAPFSSPIFAPAHHRGFRVEQCDHEAIGCRGNHRCQARAERAPVPLPPSYGQAGQAPGRQPRGDASVCMPMRDVQHLDDPTIGARPAPSNVGRNGGERVCHPDRGAVRVPRRAAVAVTDREVAGVCRLHGARAREILASFRRSCLPAYPFPSETALVSRVACPSRVGQVRVAAPA